MKKGRKVSIISRPELVKNICDLLRQGCSIRTTCQCVGLSEASFFNYLQRANPKAVDYEPRFMEFSERVTRARGEGKARLVGLINQSAAQDWRAAIALLERLSPAEYGRTAPPQPNPSATYDGGTIRELLGRALASPNPDLERIDRLRLTLQEVQAANEELLDLVKQLSAEGTYDLPHL